MTGLDARDRPAYVQAEYTFDRVVAMSEVEEQAAVLVLTKATVRPWHHTARLIQAAGSALRLLDGDFTGLDQEDRAYATELVSRCRPGALVQAEELIEATRADGVHLVTVLDEEYPGNLDFVHNFQPFLWFRGSLIEEDDRSIAVVGECHPDGPEIGQVRQDVEALTEAGFTVVAGLDPAVHSAALATGGRTIATLTHGIAMPVAPEENATLAKEVAQSGALVSPFWPSAPTTHTTVTLSRVVTSGLAAAVYLVNGGDGSGSAQQARGALAQGKHLFVPHQLHAQHQWVQRMAYRGGVTVVRDIDDLLSQVVILLDVTRHLKMF
ncbi:DNA-processing protein DprA [Microbispora sp. H10670]|uniref:DNA-processing protein DprA n=1 Tax=Microbispora sp. H10670 TaxID=2729108 RepID=UPI001601DE16|nr:DNA-processing protein DprA [Microbispora sp. H10670]